MFKYFNEYFSGPIFKGAIPLLENKYKLVYIPSKGNSVSLHIGKFSSILNTIIPFFDNFPIQGMKYLDFLDFKTVSEL